MHSFEQIAETFVLVLVHFAFPPLFLIFLAYVILLKAGDLRKV